jgi:hypothetical protein
MIRFRHFIEWKPVKERSAPASEAPQRLGGQGGKCEVCIQRPCPDLGVLTAGPVCARRAGFFARIQSVRAVAEIIARERPMT